MGATTIIVVETVPERIEVAKKLGADHVIDFRSHDPVSEIMRISDGRGVDVAIEALGTQQTFESCLRVLRPGGALSSLGVYSADVDDATVRNIRYSGPADDRREIMLTMALKAYGPKHNETRVLAVSAKNSSKARVTRAGVSLWPGRSVLSPAPDDDPKCGVGLVGLVR